MAENVTFQTTAATPPSGEVIAADDIGGVKYQRVKIMLGADGFADNDVDSGQQLSAVSLPVVLASNHSDIKVTLDSEAVTISGTVEVQSNSANLATETTAAAIQTAVEIIDNAVSGSEMQVDIVDAGSIGAESDVEAAGDGSAIAILKRLRTLLSGTLTVGSHDVTNAGTFAVQIDGINGTIDSNNSTSTPLGISGVFTGTSTDVLDYASIILAVFADQDSAADGLKIQFSTDNTNWDHADNFMVPANTGKTYTFQPVARYMRIVYTNGTTAQGAFRLQTSLRTTLVKSSSHRIQDSIVDEDDAELVKAVITGENPGGAFVNVQTTTAGNFKVAIEEVNGTAVMPVTDNGGSLTVDNADITTIAGAVSGTEMQVDVITSALPTGAATAANQLADGHNVTVDNASGASAVNIQDGGNSITVDNGGTFATQATLQANSGVDIGDVDVTSVMPGTGATNLGKAIDSVVGATDTGVALLGKHASDTIHITTAEGDYDVITISGFGALNVEPEQHHVMDSMNATTGWAATGNDTLNLATTLNHVVGTNALTFDKVNGAANTTRGAIEKIIASVDIGSPSPHDLFQTSCYLSSTANVDYVFVCVGTDSSNYNEWRISGEALTTAEWNTLVFDIGDASFAGNTGNGWDSTSITYLCIGVSMNAESDTLSGIIFDEISFHTNQHTNAAINSEVTSSVSSANVNLQKINGSVTDKGTGNASNGSQRIVIADDDTNMSAIKTAIESTLTVDLGANNDVTATGNVAHDAADSGNPIKTGSKAKLFDGTAPGTAVAEDDRVDHIATPEGRQYVETAHPNHWHVSADYAVAQTNTSLKASPGAGLKLYITDIKMSNGATGGEITILDGSGGTELDGGYFAVNGGLVSNQTTPIALSVNTALVVTSVTVTTHKVTVTGYTAA